MGWLYIRMPPWHGDVAHWRSISLNAAGPENAEGMLRLKMPDGSWAQHVSPETAGSHRLRLNTWGEWEDALWMGSSTGVLWQNTAEGGIPGELVTVDNSGGASGDAFTFADMVTFTDAGYQGRGFSFPVESGPIVGWVEPTGRNFPDLYVRFYIKVEMASEGYFEDFCWPLFSDSGSPGDPWSYNVINLVMAVWDSPTTWQLWFDAGYQDDDPRKYWDFSIPAGQWTRVELHFGGGYRNQGPMEAKVFLDPASTTPDAEKSVTVDWESYNHGNWVASPMSGVVFGRYVGDVWSSFELDGLAVSNTGWVGP